MEGKGGELSGVEQTKRYQTKRLGKKKEKEEEKILQREKKHVSYRRLIYETKQQKVQHKTNVDTHLAVEIARSSNAHGFSHTLIIII